MGGRHFSESTAQFYAKPKIQKFLDLYKLETAELVHDYVNNKLLLSFSDFFKKSYDVFNRSTRISVNHIICTNHNIVLRECKKISSIKALRYGTPFHKQFKNFQ